MTARRAALRASGILLLLAFAAANGVNALNKGGDFRVYVESGARVIAGTPMYAGSGAGDGVIGPPFQAVFFVPFAALARVSLPAARLAWYALNLVLLACAFRWWSRALAIPLQLPPAGGWFGVTWWRAAVPALAILHPLQTNFEHQNVNVLLLALGGAAAWLTTTRDGGSCARGGDWQPAREGRNRDVAAGVLVGAAAAIKAFPALLVLPALERRRWSIVSAAAAAAGLLTLVPVLRYGADGFAALVTEWLRVGARGGWPIRGNNQSLFATIARFGSPEGLHAAGRLDAAAYPELHLMWLIVVVVLLLIVCLLWMWAMRRRPQRPGPALPLGFAAAQAAAVLASPIAWDHYWVLMFPAFFVAFNAPDDAPRWVRPAFWTAAVAVTGLSRLTIGAAGLQAVRAWSLFTWAGLLLLASVLAVAAARPRREGADQPVMIHSA